MADKTITFTSTAACSCCGTVTPSCYLTMPTTIVDGTTSPYSNSTAAAAAIADQAASGCYAESLPSSDYVTITSFTSSFSTTLDIDLTTSKTQYGSAPPGAGSGGSAYFTSRVYLTASGGLSIDYSFSVSASGTFYDGSSTIIIYDDDQTTVIDSSLPGAPPQSGTYSPTIPSDGYYWIYAEVHGTYTEDNLTVSSTASISCSGDGLDPCTVRAAYGGTPDYIVCT